MSGANGAPNGAEHTEQGPAEQAAEEAKAIVIEALQAPAVILNDAERAFVGVLIGDESGLRIAPHDCGMVYRLRVKLGLEPK